MNLIAFLRQTCLKNTWKKTLPQIKNTHLLLHSPKKEEYADNGDFYLRNMFLLFEDNLYFWGEPPLWPLKNLNIKSYPT